MDDQINDDLYLLALDYRSASPGDARDRWIELEAFVEGLVSERDQLRAARIAYASEFPPIPDGDDAGMPAIDRIHENIRRLKAERDALKAELDRIRAMEPVAWILESGDGSGRYLTWGKPENYIGTPLITLEKP